MSVKPILFNTEMVRAILDDRKTVTRRVIKAEITKNQEINKNLKGKFELYDISPRCGIPKGIFFNPPYQPGDILYVRETWSYSSCANCDGDIDISVCSKRENGEEPIGCYVYRADGDGIVWDDEKTHWHPSIHMPKEAARIWLKVTDVRVERLHDMSEIDARKEGFFNDSDIVLLHSEKDYAKMWNCTIKKKDLPLYGWNANPWVWVIEFERTVKPEC